MLESRASAHDLCKGLLSLKPTPEVQGAGGLVAYLGALLENQVIGDETLLRLIQGLKKGELTNPISENEAMLSSIAQIHREGLQIYIDDQALDRTLLLEWAQKTHAERNRVQVAREETRGVTQEIYRKMAFLPIPAGSFWMGEEESKVLVRITRPFEIMSTPITQSMWAKVMGENPSKFKDGDHSVTVLINGRPVQMQPDHPVEQISWNDLQVLIKKFNEQDPDYEYRLPTEVEWEYAARAGTDTLYSFGNDPKELPFYGWFKENSNRQTHEVGGLKPNSLGLYDMHGNVWEWVSDRDDNDSYRKFRDGAWNNMIRGGGWCNDAPILGCASRTSYDPGYRDDNIGARLVRTPKGIQSESKEYKDVSQWKRAIKRLTRMKERFKEKLPSFFNR